MARVLLMLVVFVGVMVFPVMFAARMVGADKTGFGRVLLTVFFQSCLSSLAENFAPNILYAILVAVIGGSAIYAFMLGTTMLRGFVIGVLSLGMAILILVVFAGADRMFGI